MPGLTKSAADEPLDALCRFIAFACGADLVMALEIGAGGNAVAVASSSAQAFTGFSLAASGILDQTWTAEPVAANTIRLPSAIVGALENRPNHLLFVPTPLSHAPASGLLLFWTRAPTTVTEHVTLLAASVATLLTARSEQLRQAVIGDHFNDLFESVPSGIVLIDSDGQTGTINTRAAELLGCPPGPHPAGALTEPMRALRQRCDNHAELEAAYAEHVGNAHFAAAHYWVLDRRTLEVDTHPVRGDGALGRIWLFTDVTAELLMAAELRRLASSDPLTGMPNRRAFEERAAPVIATRQARGVSVALLMIDVDHFKAINDAHGHPVGDEVLKSVARRCRVALRDRDLFARFGGEEFVALLSVRTQDEVLAVAERLRKTIAERPFAVGTASIAVTISIGGASREPGAGDNCSLLDELVAQADGALYAAKAGGRDRVTMAH